MGSGIKVTAARDTQASLPGWRRKLTEREFALFKDHVNVIWAKQLRLSNMSKIVNLASSSCNSTGLLGLPIREI